MRTLRSPSRTMPARDWHCATVLGCARTARSAVAMKCPVHGVQMKPGKKPSRRDAPMKREINMATTTAPKKGDFLRFTQIKPHMVIRVLHVRVLHENPRPDQWAWEVKAKIVEHSTHPKMVGEIDTWNLSPDVCEQVKR